MAVGDNKGDAFQIGDTVCVTYECPYSGCMKSFTDVVTLVELVDGQTWLSFRMHCEHGDRECSFNNENC